MRRVRLSQAVRRLPGAGAGARGGRARGRSVVRVRADRGRTGDRGGAPGDLRDGLQAGIALESDRKSTRLNSSHGYISYAVFCLKKKKKKKSKPQFRQSNNETATRAAASSTRS